MAESDQSTTTFASEASENLETENLIETYNCVAEWIRFADAKAAVVLTVGGALASVLIPSLKPYLDTFEDGLDGWGIAVVAAFVVWFVLLALSCVWAFLCILPLRRKGRHPSLGRCTHFHSAAIADKYGMDQVDDFVADFERMGMASFKNEVLAGLLIDSHISSTKYTRVSTAIRLLGASAVFGFLYMLATQF